MVDTARVAVYGAAWSGAQAALAPAPLLATAVGAAFLGSWLGSRLVHKTTLAGVQRVVATLLAGLGLLMAAGLV